jgi:hypothetical protein
MSTQVLHMNRREALIFSHVGGGQAVSAMVLFALIALCITLPLFLGRSLPDSHDIIFHIFQSDQFSRSLQEGLWYPRWVPDANNGYGSPNFVFYAPLSYAFTAVLRHFSLPLIPAVISSVWFAFFLSGVTMFIAASRLFSRTAALTASILYQIVPFHLLVLYERGGYAELFAFVWFPLTLLFLVLLAERPQKTAFVGLSMSYAGLILTHLVSAYMFTIVLALFVVHRFLLPGAGRERLPEVLLSLCLGLGLSAVYLMPAALEEKFVHIDYITKCVIGDYRNNFLSIMNISNLQGFQLEMRIYAFVEIVFFGVLIFFSRKATARVESKDRNFFILVFVAAVLLTTQLSRPAWAVIPGLPVIQFPWRWLSIVEVALCFLVGSVLSTEEKWTSPISKLKNATVVFFVLFFAAVAMYFVTTSALLPDSLLGRVISVREYNPLWVHERDKIISEHPVVKVRAVSGTAVCRVTSWKAEEREISVDASTPATLRIATFYFPGWKARLDHRVIPIRVEMGTGAMLLDVPEGRHEVLLRFGYIPPMRYASIISLVSLFLLGAIVTVYDAVVPGKRQRDFPERGG